MSDLFDTRSLLVTASTLLVLGLFFMAASCSSGSPARAAGNGADAASSLGGSVGGTGGGGDDAGGTGGEVAGSGGRDSSDSAAGAAGGGGAGNGAADGSAGAGGVSAGMGLLWYGDPDKGDTVFKSMNEDAGCTVTVVDDPVYGKVRKFNRPPGVNRCEAKGAVGIDSKEGDLIYIGMRYKIEAPQDLTVTGILQWKTYDTPGHPNTLNYPVLIRPNGGRLVVETQKPRADAWSIPTPIDTWFSVVLAIKESYEQETGYIEFWYNGEQQMLKGGTTRYYCQTLDGGFIDPKWGIYGTNGSPKPQSASFITSMRIATDYVSAAPESY
jgi:hypothetical protein